MKKNILALSLLAVAAFSASARPTVLSLKESIKDSSIVYPESFETDTQELMKNWYLQNYTVLDDSGADLTDVPTTDEDYISRLKALPTVIEMPYNSIVRSYIDMYTQRRRQLVEEMLGLGLYYTPIFEQALEKEGVPLELKYLPVIESALNPDAVSRVGATGLWQFMLGTAKGLGLEVNSLVDERRDPIRSSEMAAKYLKQLYGIYGDWSLAIASYNCGPGNVNKALRRAGGGKKDFWDIYFFLPAETRGYVPAFIAANYVMTYYNDHDLGKSLAKRPIITDTVHVDKRVHFDQISAVLNIPVEELRVLNPQYRKDEIPGDIRPYALTLPSQQVYSYIVSEDSIVNHNLALYARRTTVEPSDGSTTVAADGKTKTTVKYHKVKRGETLSKVARKYGVSTASVKKWNGLRSNRLKRGQTLRINIVERIEEEDVPEKDTLTAAADKNEETVSGTSPAVTASTEECELPEADLGRSEPENPEYHKVARGESLGKIAARYGVSVADLKKWNNLSSNNIMAGQRLLVDAGKAPVRDNGGQGSSTHTVKSGESLSSIAERYGVSVADLKSWNGLSGDNIKAGQKLKVNGTDATPSRNNEPAVRTKIHTVKRGESLGKIAARYGVSVADLKSWNGLSGDDIQVGQKISIGGKSSGTADKKKTTTKRQTYKVKSGDTLGGIAEKYGTTASAIRKANGIKGSNIRVGQTLVIP